MKALAFAAAAALALLPARGADVSPGLTLTFSAGGQQDVREARLVALYLPAGQPPTPALPAGPFTATWSGTIASPLRAQYTFTAEVQGELKLTINGQPAPLGEQVQLKKGASELKVEFKSPEEGEALVRLYWSSKEFPPEPVPPAVFGQPAPAEALQAAARWREGRLIFAERRCAACHEGGELLPARGEGMPELAHDAPLFADFGARYHEAWLAHWISDPQSIRPHSLMPRVFPGPAGKIDQRAADIAAYLIALGQRNDAKPAEDQAPAGGALFANLGCVACHTAPEAEGQDEFQRVPLRHLRAKWQAPALQDYLQDPQKLYRWTKMPNFRLTAAEAGQLTAFLLAGQQQEFPAGPKGDPAKGAALTVSAGCMNCHAGVPPAAAPKLADTLKSRWARGCVADTPAERGKAPDFAFTAAERKSLRALALVGFESLKHDLPTEFAQRQVKALRCAACHPADANLSTWSQLENEMAPLQAAAPVPEGEGQPLAGANAPVFTWFGEKLRTKWAAQFIAGTLPEKPRPWLIARMPGFGVRGELLAQGLSLEHGFPVEDKVEEPAADDILKAGETLLGESGGFNCTTCHAVGERPATAVFEAPGINFALTTERMRKEYYHRWVYFPQRIDPDTKMPKFADDEGKTPLTDILHGDARAQYEAIWQYLLSLKK
jgi:cytochrome c1